VEIIMALNPQESQQIGRIEAKVDILLESDKECEIRLSKLESWSSKSKGALAILSLLFTLGCAYIVAGCAHMHDISYYPSGAIQNEVVSTVIGTGETTLLIECDNGEKFYTTRDTGISDNAVEGVEAGVTVTPPGAVAGFLGGLLGRLPSDER
jgi:hypothetical protein